MLQFLGSTFFGLMLLGVPIAFVLGICAVGGFLLLHNPAMMKLIPQRLLAGVDSFPLMAVPFFILAGEVMNKCGFTERIVKLANVLVGWIVGGLAHVNIVASILFAGVSGAAAADVAGLGSILIPAMEKEGYGKPFSAAITAASSIIGPIIPPSIIMIIYGAYLNISVAALFAAGFIPGLMIGFSLMVATYFIARRRNYPKRTDPLRFREVLLALKESILALIFPIILMGGILSGIFTPTEASAVAVMYALIVALLIFRSINISDLYSIFLKATLVSSIVLFIIACATALGWLLAKESVPQLAANAILSITQNRYLILILINILLLITGMFINGAEAVIVLGPILAPMAVSLGIDPLHFAMIFLINLIIGLITPPVGIALFVAVTVSKISMEEIVKEIIPFLAVELVILILVTYIPIITLFVPKLFHLI